MRCSSCNKFVSQEPGEPEVQSLEIDADGNITAEVRIVVTCAECGDELKESTLSMEDAVTIRRHNREECELEIEEDGVEMLDEYETKDRNGKPIKSVRYQTHLYGARVDFHIRCACQKSEAEPLFSGDIFDTIPAGSMDEC